MKKKKQKYVHRVIVRTVSPYDVSCHHTMCSSQSAFSRGLPIFLGRSLDLLWELWGQFSLRSGLGPACTCSQSPQLPPVSTVSGYCRDFVCCPSGCRNDFPSSSSVTRPLTLCFGLGSTSTCRPPSGICSLPRQNGVKAEAY